MTTWNIKKTDEDRYHVGSRDLIDDFGFLLKALHEYC